MGVTTAAAAAAVEIDTLTTSQQSRSDQIERANERASKRGGRLGGGGGGVGAVAVVGASRT